MHAVRATLEDDGVDPQTRINELEVRSVDVTSSGKADQEELCGSGSGFSRFRTMTYSESRDIVGRVDRCIPESAHRAYAP